jgi:hypothetical protein
MNTGEEDEATLQFADKCDKEFGLNLVWLEAVVIHEAGKGTQHRVVDFASASRNGEPFEQAIKKFGIPNKHYPHCTRELKQRPFYSYLRSLGLKKGDYRVAIGIRYDELDRMSSRRKEDGIEYPLIDKKITKPTVGNFWSLQSFRLNLAEHRGNCKTCWKKSFKKLDIIRHEEPSRFAFNARMEAAYPYAGPGSHDGPRHFFRGNRSTADVLAGNFPGASEGYEHEADTGCGESCEVFADD